MCFGYDGEMSTEPRTVTFDGAPAAGVINFGVGQPSEDLLPVGLLRTATADFMATAQPLELNYGERQGDAGFRAALANFLTPLISILLKVMLIISVASMVGIATTSSS